MAEEQPADPPVAPVEGEEEDVAAMFDLSKKKKKVRAPRKHLVGRDRPITRPALPHVEAVFVAALRCTPPRHPLFFPSPDHRHDTRTRLLRRSACSRLPSHSTTCLCPAEEEEEGREGERAR